LGFILLTVGLASGWIQLRLLAAALLRGRPQSRGLRLSASALCLI